MVSLVGSAVTYVVMPVLVYGMTRSATWTAMVAVAEGVAYLIGGLWAGALADHHDRARIMVVADVIVAVVLSSIPIAWWLDVLTAPQVLVVGFLAQGVFVFFDAANQGALPSLVPRSRLPSANSLVFGGGTVVDTVVPAVAGLLIVAVAPASLIAVDVITFLASAALVRAIVRPLSATRASTRPSHWGAVLDGIRFIARHEIVRIMTVIGSMQAFSGGALVAVLVVWADETLAVREGDWRLGMLFAIWGAGAIVGSLLMPRAIRRFGAVRSALIFLPLSAGAGILTSFVGTFPLACLMLLVWGLAYMGVASTSLTLRQLVTPEHLMSRVMVAGRMVSFGAGYPIGALVSGLIAESHGASRAILICQVTISLGALIAWLSPLRNAPKELAVAEDPAPA